MKTIFNESEEILDSNLRYIKTRGEIADLSDWKQIGHFGDYLLYKNGDQRMTVEPTTKRIVARYEFIQSGDNKIDAGV
jgi:hypothetical protein